MNILHKALFKPSPLLKSTLSPSLRFFSAEAAPQYQNILFEKKEGGVGYVQLNRPKALNALCDALY